MRACSVTIEKTHETSWPPLEIEVNAKIVSLTDIFAEAGLRLQFEFGEGNLRTDRNGTLKGALNRSELHALFSSRGFSSRESKHWRAHVLIVPRIAYREAGRVERPYGVMYDFGPYDLNGRPREGCAIAYDRVRHDPRVYLRTLAHELGHVFNLLHPCDDIPPQPMGTTLMNRTTDLGNPRRRLGRFPENVTWEFSPHDCLWLSVGPEDYVRPGGKPFGARPRGWQAETHHSATELV